MPDAAPRPVSSVALLVFSLAEARFALRVETVVAAVRAVAIAALPSAPPMVEGVVNYRGTVVPVLDIRARFGLPARALRPDQHMIVARSGARTVVLRVDAAHDLVDVQEDAIEAPERAVPGARHVAGIVRLVDGLIVISDLAAFLSADEEARLDAAMGR